jgi:hypothetical protein
VELNLEGTPQVGGVEPWQEATLGTEPGCALRRTALLCSSESLKILGRDYHHCVTCYLGAAPRRLVLYPGCASRPDGRDARSSLESQLRGGSYEPLNIRLELDVGERKAESCTRSLFELATATEDDLNSMFTNIGLVEHELPALLETSTEDPLKPKPRLRRQPTTPSSAYSTVEIVSIEDKLEAAGHGNRDEAVMIHSFEVELRFG